MSGVPIAGGQRRLDQLDSLRGLAAMTVFVHHILLTQPLLGNPQNASAYAWLKYTPLAALWAGTEAVLFFFLLSGFVLALPFFHLAVSYRSFVVRRLFRIYLPYWLVVAAALALQALVDHGRIDELSIWFNRQWQAPVTLGLLAQHTVLIGSFNVDALVPVIWSLVHEMRISLIFPLIMFAVVRWPWKPVLAVAYVIGGIGTIATVLDARLLGINQDYTLTLEYIPIFVAGALLAKHRIELAGWFARRDRAAQLGLLGFALLAYTYSYLTFGTGPLLHLWNLVDNTMITIGASIVLVAALGSSRFIGLLLLRPLVAIGRASYSLYLWHTVILLSLTHLLYGQVPDPILIVLIVAVTALVTTASYWYVERPSVSWGRGVAGKLSPPVSRQTASAP